METPSQPGPSFYLEAVDWIRTALPVLAEAKNDGSPLTTDLLDWFYETAVTLEVFSDLFTAEDFHPEMGSGSLISAGERLVAVGSTWFESDPPDGRLDDWDETP